MRNLSGIYSGGVRKQNGHWQSGNKTNLHELKLPFYLNIGVDFLNIGRGNPYPRTGETRIKYLKCSAGGEQHTIYLHGSGYDGIDVMALSPVDRPNFSVAQINGFVPDADMVQGNYIRVKKGKKLHIRYYRHDDTEDEAKAAGKTSHFVVYMANWGLYHGMNFPRMGIGRTDFTLLTTDNRRYYGGHILLPPSLRRQYPKYNDLRRILVMDDQDHSQGDIVSCRNNLANWNATDIPPSIAQLGTYKLYTNTAFNNKVSPRTATVGNYTGIDLVGYYLNTPIAFVGDNHYGLNRPINSTVDRCGTTLMGDVSTDNEHYSQNELIFDLYYDFTNYNEGIVDVELFKIWLGFQETTVYFDKEIPTGGFALGNVGLNKWEPAGYFSRTRIVMEWVDNAGDNHYTP